MTRIQRTLADKKGQRDRNPNAQAAKTVDQLTDDGLPKPGTETRHNVPKAILAR